MIGLRAPDGAYGAGDPYRVDSADAGRARLGAVGTGRAGESPAVDLVSREWLAGHDVFSSMIRVPEAGPVFMDR